MKEGHGDVMVDRKAITCRVNDGIECIGMTYSFGEDGHKHEAVFKKLGSRKWVVTLLTSVLDYDMHGSVYLSSFEMPSDKMPLESVIATGLNAIKCKIANEVAAKSAIEFMIAEETRGM